jgi:branched-chain amino acid transport system ATP-binding protein
MPEAALTDGGATTGRLNVLGLVSGYGKSTIVDGVSLDIKQDTITLLIGRNGSGKSTFIKSIFGLTQVFEGIVRVDDVDITNAAVSERIDRGIRYVPQTGGVFGSMSVRENLRMACAGAGGSVVTERVDGALELFPTLMKVRKQRAGELSGGQQRLLAFAMGTMTMPSFLLVDEPSAGLSPVLAQRVIRHLAHIRDERKTGILLVEQNVKEGCNIADEVCLLRDGRMHWQGGPDELLAQPSLAAFL